MYINYGGQIPFLCNIFVSIDLSVFYLFNDLSGTETDQGEYIQKIIDSLPLDKLVITWIQFLTILQDPSECGDVSVKI